MYIDIFNKMKKNELRFNLRCLIINYIQTKRNMFYNHKNIKII
jgi:hypothetical protein